MSLTERQQDYRRRGWKMRQSATVQRRLIQPEPGTFGALLKDLIESRATTQQQLAVQIGIEHSNVSLWISGKRIPTSIQVERMAAALDLTGAARIQFFAAAGLWPFDTVPGLADAARLAGVMRSARYREIARAEWAAVDDD